MTTTKEVETAIGREDVVKKLASSKVTLDDVLKSLAPVGEQAPQPKKVPLPAVITQAQKDALALLPSVFGKVVPTEPRAITPVEVDALLAERDVLDQIDKLVKVRKEGIRTTVLNHVDVELADVDVQRDKEGHKLAEADVFAPEHDKHFSWEIRSGGGDLDAEKLRALDEAGVIGHDDYLAMTEQVRVVNPNRVLEVLKAKPSLLDALSLATTPITKVGSLNVRANKG